MQAWERISVNFVQDRNPVECKVGVTLVCTATQAHSRTLAYKIKHTHT